MGSAEVDFVSLFAFSFVAFGLLASPGFGVSQTITANQISGYKPGVWSYLGLKAGLAIAAALSVVGVAVVLAAAPALKTSITIIACAYLLYQAIKIATSPVGIDSRVVPKIPSGRLTSVGLFMGATKPRVILAFAALMVPFTVVVQDVAKDALVKWTVAVGVILIVDLFWQVLAPNDEKTPAFGGFVRMLNCLRGSMILMAGLALE